ncbi:hypothetical protein [Oxobacter pfennigii]|uniref:hypothetical protein n=1 Tax=Oxobacter pfennigii TaxID=36849 RepID=UPI0006D40B81|nr:hypothetical protein [Oxobacter pfennigii]
MIEITSSWDRLDTKVKQKVKEDIFKAQRLYYLYQKLGKRAPRNLNEFCKNNLNNYIKLAKQLDISLTPEELYNRLFKK